MWQKILNFLMKLFWPEVKKLVKKLLREITAWIIQILVQEIKDRFKKQRESATRKAEEAERQSKQSQDKQEANTLKAIAQVWREVAETFRIENEELREEVRGLKDMIEYQADKKIDIMDFNDTFTEGEKNSVTLRDKPNYLALTAPTGDQGEETF